MLQAINSYIYYKCYKVMNLHSITSQTVKSEQCSLRDVRGKVVTKYGLSNFRKKCRIISQIVTGKMFWECNGSENMTTIGINLQLLDQLQQYSTFHSTPHIMVILETVFLVNPVSYTHLTLPTNREV